MKINRSFRSPNFDAKGIPVEFVVIHYTACSLQTTFEVFRDKERKVSSHLIISNTGEVYESVKCWDDVVLRAWHAGQSRYLSGDKEWNDFNDFSIGIELVNFNGNLHDYSEKQYDTLFSVIRHFKAKHKCLEAADRIVGHEQIAGWRGKVDPGWHFNWKRLYDECYAGADHPKREPVLPHELKLSFEKFLNCIPHTEEGRAMFWNALSSNMEIATGLIKKDK